MLLHNHALLSDKEFCFVIFFVRPPCGADHLDKKCGVQLFNGNWTWATLFRTTIQISHLVFRPFQTFSHLHINIYIFTLCVSYKINHCKTDNKHIYFLPIYEPRSRNNPSTIPNSKHVIHSNSLLDSTPFPNSHIKKEERSAIKLESSFIFLNE